MPTSKYPGSPSKFPAPVSSKFPSSAVSKFPAASSDARDTGPHLFIGGKLYYRQLDELAINMCVAKSISDAQWLEFLEGSLRVARKIGRMPKVTMAMFTATYPDAKQRRQTGTFLKGHSVKPIGRLGLLSDNPLVRGAIVAFNWVVPDASVLAFGPRDVGRCLQWLQEVASFDATTAAAAWSEGRAAVGSP